MGSLKTYTTESPQTPSPAPALPAPTSQATQRPTTSAPPVGLFHLAAPGSNSNSSQGSGAILNAQRHYGNRVVQRMLDRNISPLQHPVQRKCACGGSCSACKEEELRRARVQRQAADSLEGMTGVLQDLDRHRSGGQPLDPATRSFMEPKFGQDFSGVRIHNDSQANQLAQGLHSHAFTTGRDIFFAPGQYAPNTTAGKKLLAHELTHVVQQGNASSVQTMAIGQSGDAFEQEADRAAEAISSGDSIRTISLTPVPFLQRQPVTDCSRALTLCQERDPNAHPVVWPFPSWSTAGHGDLGSRLVDNNIPSSAIIMKLPNVERDDRGPGVENYRAMLQLLLTGRQGEAQLICPNPGSTPNLSTDEQPDPTKPRLSGGQIHHKLPLFLGGVDDPCTNMTYLAQREHVDWHRLQDLEGKSGNIRRDPDGTKYCIIHYTCRNQIPRPARPTGSGKKKKKTLKKNPPLFDLEFLDREYRAGDTAEARVPQQYANALPGFRLQNASFTIGSDLEPADGRITATPTIPFLRSRTSTELLVDATGQIQLNFRAPVSLGALGETELLVQLQAGKVSANASLTPRPAFLRSARADVAFEEGQFSGGLTFTPQGLQLPIPGLTVENVQGGLTFNNQGITGSGGATFKYQGLGEAAVTIGYQNRQFSITGNLAVNIPGMTAPVMGDVSYRNQQLIAQVRLTRENFPQSLPLQSGAITIRLVDGQIQGSGHMGVRLGAVGNGNLTFGYQNGTVEMGAGINLTIPGLRGASITVRYREGQLEGEADVPIDSDRIPGLNGSVRVRYREGRFGGETQISFRRGDLGGSITIRVDQLENGELAIGGGGEVSARITPWLTGRVQVDLVRDQRNQPQINVQGDIRAPNEIQLFPRKEIRRERTFPRVDIPIWGFTVPVIRSYVGVVAFIEAGGGFVAYVGPGVLRNIGVAGTFNTEPGQQPSFDISGEFFLPAGAEAYLFVGGGIALGAAIASIEGSIRLQGSLGAQAGLSVIPHIGFANNDYYFRGEMELQALSYLRFSGAARAAVSVPIWGEVWSNEWPLFDWVYPLGLNVGLRGRMDYTFGRAFDPTFEFQSEELDPTAIARSAVTPPGQSPRSGPGSGTPPRSQIRSEVVPGARGGAGARPAPAPTVAPSRPAAPNPAIASAPPTRSAPAPRPPARSAPAPGQGPASATPPGGTPAGRPAAPAATPAASGRETPVGTPSPSRERPPSPPGVTTPPRPTPATAPTTPTARPAAPGNSAGQPPQSQTGQVAPSPAQRPQPAGANEYRFRSADGEEHILKIAVSGRGASLEVQSNPFSIEDLVKDVNANPHPLFKRKLVGTEKRLVKGIESAYQQIVRDNAVGNFPDPSKVNQILDNLRALNLNEEAGDTVKWGDKFMIYGGVVAHQDRPGKDGKGHTYSKHVYKDPATWSNLNAGVSGVSYFENVSEANRWIRLALNERSADIQTAIDNNQDELTILFPINQITGRKKTGAGAVVDVQGVTLIINPFRNRSNYFGAGNGMKFCLLTSFPGT